MKCVDCYASALFKSYDNICCLSWLSLLLDGVLMYKSDSFLTIEVHYI